MASLQKRITLKIKKSMTPCEIRIGTVPRTVTTVTSGFELHADTEFFVNENYFGKILLVMISNITTKNLSESFCHLVRFNILTKTAHKISIPVNGIFPHKIFKNVDQIFLPSAE